MKTGLKMAGLAMLCFAVFTVASAFKGDKVIAKGSGFITYTYNLDTSTGARNASNWTLATGSTPSCGAAGSVPCKIVFDSSVYPTLQDYIDSQHFSSDAEVAYGPGVVSKQ